MSSYQHDAIEHGIGKKCTVALCYAVLQAYKYSIHK